MHSTTETYISLVSAHDAEKSLTALHWTLPRLPVVEEAIVMPLEHAGEMKDLCAWLRSTLHSAAAMHVAVTREGYDAVVGALVGAAPERQHSQLPSDAVTDTSTLSL